MEAIVAAAVLVCFVLCLVSFVRLSELGAHPFMMAWAIALVTLLIAVILVFFSF